jgi:hypothetical protein
MDETGQGRKQYRQEDAGVALQDLELALPRNDVLEGGGKKAGPADETGYDDRQQGSQEP